MTSLDIELPTDAVSPIRRLQPGEVLDVVQKLRSLLSTMESAAFTLYASFEELGGPALEKEAEKTRHTLELATARIATLTAALEKGGHYSEQRRAILAIRDGED